MNEEGKKIERKIVEETERKRKENESSVRVRGRGALARRERERGGEKEGTRSRKERRPGEWDIERRPASGRRPTQAVTSRDASAAASAQSEPCAQPCGPHRLLVFPDLRRVFLILFARTKTCSPHAPRLCTPRRRRRYAIDAYFYFLPPRSCCRAPGRIVFLSLSLSLHAFLSSFYDLDAFNRADYFPCSLFLDFSDRSP